MNIIASELVKDFQKNHETEKVSFLKKGNLKEFLLLKQKVKSSETNFIVTDYTSDDDFIKYDESFREELLSKGIVKLNNNNIENNIITNVDINDKIKELIESNTNLIFTPNNLINECRNLNCKIIFFDENLIKNINIGISDINVNTKIYFCGLIIPKVFLFNKLINNFFHVQIKEFNLRYIISSILGEVQEKDSQPEINQYPSYISLKDYEELYQNEETIKLFDLKTCLEKDDQYSLEYISNVISNKNNINLFQKLIKHDTKTKSNIINFWKALVISSKFFKNNFPLNHDLGLIYSNLRTFIPDILSEKSIINRLNEIDYFIYILGNNRFLEKLDINDSLPNELFDELIKRLKLNKLNWHQYSILFFFRKGDFKDLNHEILCKQQNIFQHFLFFNDSTNFNSPYILHPDLNNKVTKSDPISFCLWFTTYINFRDYTNKYFSDKRFDILEFLFSDHPLKTNDFVLSLFIFYAKSSNFDFINEQILLLIDSLNYNRTRVSYYTDILINFKPLSLPDSYNK